MTWPKGTEQDSRVEICILASSLSFGKITVEKVNFSSFVSPGTFQVAEGQLCSTWHFVPSSGTQGNCPTLVEQPWDSLRRL